GDCRGRRDGGAARFSRRQWLSVRAGLSVRQANGCRGAGDLRVEPRREGSPSGGAWPGDSARAAPQRRCRRQLGMRAGRGLLLDADARQREDAGDSSLERTEQRLAPAEPIYDAPHLARNPANFTALTPLGFLARTAATYPDKLAVI